MLLSYFVGLAAAVGQHLFYSELVGDYVGTTSDQQRVLRCVPYFNSSPRCLVARNTGMNTD